MQSLRASLGHSARASRVLVPRLRPHPRTALPHPENTLQISGTPKCPSRKAQATPVFTCQILCATRSLLSTLHALGLLGSSSLEAAPMYTARPVSARHFSGAPTPTPQCRDLRERGAHDGDGGTR